jgi:hypothetical protein
VLAMAGNGARVADGCRGILLSRRGGGWIASEACIETLSERTEVARTCIELLYIVSRGTHTVLYTN